MTFHTGVRKKHLFAFYADDAMNQHVRVLTALSGRSYSEVLRILVAKGLADLGKTDGIDPYLLKTDL